MYHGTSEYHLGTPGGIRPGLISYVLVSGRCIGLFSSVNDASMSSHHRLEQDLLSRQRSPVQHSPAFYTAAIPSGGFAYSFTTAENTATPAARPPRD